MNGTGLIVLGSLYYFLQQTTTVARKPDLLQPPMNSVYMRLVSFQFLSGCFNVSLPTLS